MKKRLRNLKEWSSRGRISKAVLILIGMLLLMVSQGSAITQGQSSVDLTWDRVYGDGYLQSAKVQLTVADTNGNIKATADTTTTEQGLYAVEPESFSTTDGKSLNIRSGDEVTVVVGSGESIETDVITTNINAFTSATLDEINVKSLPNKSMYLVVGYGGVSSTTTIQTDSSGNYTYVSSSDIVPNDYFTIYYEDENGNTITTNPIAPYGMASITDDKVWGFYYPPETTATVDIYSNGIKVGSTVGKTDLEGDFNVNDCIPQKDIKNGYKVAITCSSEKNEYYADLTASTDFISGKISGKTDAGSHIIAHVKPASGAAAVDFEADAQTNGNYALVASPGLKDDIWVAAIHPDGNITQLQVVYGTNNVIIGSPAISAGDKGKDAGNVRLEEIRPQSLKKITGSNSLTLKIKTEGVRFAILPKVIPTGVNLEHYQAAVTDDSRTATWNISDVTTSTAGSILLSQIKYDVDTNTVVGPVTVELGGNCGVSTEMLVNAKIEPYKTTAEIKGAVLDGNTGSGINGAKIALFKNGSKLSEIKTSSTGGFSFPVIQKDNYSLVVSRIGYTSANEQIDLSAGDYSKDFKLNKTNIGVFTPLTSGTHIYESIESKLSDMGYSVCKIGEDELSSSAELKTNLDTIFINSSDVVLSSNQKQTIKEFVNGGGSLYLSGTSSDIIKDSFSGLVVFPVGESTSTMGTMQTIEAKTTNPMLANYIKSGSTTATVELEFEGESKPWRPISSINPAVEVYLTGDIEFGGAVRKNSPVVVGFNSGDGRVLFTSYYDGVDGGSVSEGVRRLSSYIVSSCLMAGKNGMIKSQLKRDGYTDVTVFSGIMENTGTTNSISYNRNVPAGKKMAASVGWLSGSYGFQLKSPNGAITEATNFETIQSALICKISNPQEGIWDFNVVPKSLPSGGSFYSVVIGIGNIDQSSGGNNGGGGSSSGSSNTGNSIEQKIETDQTLLPIPSGLKATSAKTNIELNWAPVSGENIAGYNVYRAMRGDKELTRLNTETVTGAIFTDTTAQAKKLYYYMISSVSKTGKEGTLSSFVAATLIDVLGEVAFADVPKGAWYKEYLTKLFFTNIIDGYPNGTFKPQANITRAEFCKTLLNAIGIEASTSSASSFNDAKQHWATSYIEAAQQLGLIDGYGDGSFRPNNFISRSEIAKMVVKTKDLPVDDKPSGFSDCVGCWADPYISSLKEKQIVSGYAGNIYKPQNFTTRAESCKVIWLMLEK